MAIPVSSSLTPLNAEVFIQEGYELSLDSIVPSITLTGSYSTTTSYTQFFIYDFAKNIVSQNLDYNLNGSYLTPEYNTSISNSSSSYNQFEISPSEDVYNQGFSSGNYYALYNFIDYELGSKTETTETNSEQYNGHPYFIKNISGDRTELRIQNNFLTSNQIESYYNEFSNKINARENADEFYISFEGNRNFIGVNSQLELSLSGSSNPTSILLKLYKPLPLEFEIEQELQIISKVGETQVYSVNFTTNLEFVDNLLQLKGPNYNVDLKDRINNSTNFKTLDDLINTNSSQSYYQFNSLNDQKGVAIRKNWGDWNEFVKYSSAEQRLNNFKSKLSSIEIYEGDLASLENIGGTTPGTPDYSSSYNNISNNINQIISKFDSYEYFLYYITGSESWPKYTTTYPYTNFSVTSSEALNWFGSTNESSPYFNTGKNQIYSASRYDENNQDYLYYLIPPFITNNSNNDQYVKFVNMTGQSFDEMFLYTEAVEQVRNTNSSLTGSVLPLGLADEIIESLGFDVGGNSFNSIDFNPNSIGVYPTANSGLEYIDRYIDIASGSIINYYDTQQSTLGYVIALADPSFPYPLDNATQEIYKRIFHNMISLVKRKGTVTGLRQLINIWGVPNTMLRISEFGGKNKNDENDYDLWMNRYSTAMSTIPISESISSTTKPSGSIRIPWQPLTGNYVDGNAPSSYYSVPDCIQFRFKAKQPTSAISQFTQSLLVKGDLYNGTADFGISLAYSGSQSGSFSGSVLPNDSQYGHLRFHLSGSTPEGGILSTSPISLPFFDGGWWSVQVQRTENFAYTDDGFPTPGTNTYELKVANNIYDGYDGNQIGFTGSSALDPTDIGPSHNMAWNDIHGVTTLSPSANSFAKGYSAVALGGMMDNGANNENTFIGSGTNPSAPGIYDRIKIGEGFLGDFQEFRFYRRSMSASQFNDYVMNPESIQGHADSNTGAGSSYDLLSFRLPLGNELEYTEVSGSANDVDWNNAQGGQVKFLSFGGNSFFSGENAFGSLHPSLVNKQGSLFTSSFITTNNVTSSQYGIAYQGRTGAYTSAITSSYLKPNTEINYMDQPAAGIRNRIKNKIQVIDGNEYSTTLSPFRSIQQEFEQSSSYTEDLNSLEVGFSFQNEINDDIIATFGHGVVSDAIADPRFISESLDIYPELTRIAEDYFKKYQGTAITDPTYNGGLPTIIEKEYDYNRLIKFYETSLFKAIKNYVPARTSLSTGIIVKQHLLERNKTQAITGININTPIAKTPETGSDVYGYTDQTGFNSVISQRNLLITSSITVGSLTGSAGGSVNKYNIITNEGQFYKNVTSTLKTLSLGSTYDLYDTLPPANSALNIKIATALDSEGKVFQQSEVAFRSQLRWKPSFTGTPAGNCAIVLEATSSKRGGIFSTEFPYDTSTASPSAQVSNNFVEIYPDERIYWRIGATGVILQMNAYIFQFGEAVEFTKPEPLSSQQVNWYIDDFTGEYKVDDHQTEFYDGEFSGSNFEVIPPQYNPYRIFADGNDRTPDTLFSTSTAPIPYVDFTQGGGDPSSFTIGSATQITASSVGSFENKFWTGSFFNLVPGATYEIKGHYNRPDPGGSSNFYPNSAPAPITSTLSSIFTGFLMPAGDTAGNVDFTYQFVATNNYPDDPTVQPYSSGPGSGFDNGGAKFFQSTISTEIYRLKIDSIILINTLGPKHFYERDGFTIVPSQSQLFQNSPYNPIINNVSGSRENSFYYDMDFDPVNPGSELKEGIPSDYTLLVSASQLGWNGANPTADNLLEYAEVPDSNYTTKAIINPRYVGTTLQSADYNFYTGVPSQSRMPAGIKGLANPPSLLAQNKVRYINGETGSWTGDTSYGKNAVIDVHPINIAHFKQSYENLSVFDTSTFIIDQLIQIPFEEILDEQSPIISSSLINGSNENLIPVSSTFAPSRKAAVLYNNPTKTFVEFNNIILNYGQLGIGSNLITAGATDWKTYWTNQLSPSIMTVTQSFFAPAYTRDVDEGITTQFQVEADNVVNQIGLNFYYPEDRQPYLSPVDSPNLISGNISASWGMSLFSTGSSTHAENKGLGILNLRGLPFSIPTRPGNFTGGNAGILYGPSLQILNSLNRCQIIYGDANPSSTLGIPNYLPGIQNILKLVADAGSTSYDTFWGSQALVGNSMGQQSLGTSANSNQVVIIPILNPNEISNLYRTDFSGSGLDNYEQLPNNAINIEPGDEIRVSYGYPTDQSTGASNEGVIENVVQDFQVIDYELAPPVVVTDSFNFPASNSTFNVYLSGLITSSNVEFRNNPFQIDEYKKRLDIAVTNNVCMYFADTNNSTEDTIASGSFLNSCQYDSYVVNNEGENRPTKIKVTINRTAVRYPSTTVGNTGATGGWIFGTNNYGIVEKSLKAYGDGYALQGPYITDGESFPRNVNLDPGFLFDRLMVSPNPTTLAKPIPSGSILSATLRKRIENDSRIVINLNQPQGSEGIQTPSGDGYLIPDDLTPIQQGNVQKIINKLKSENVFTQDSPSSLGN